MTDSAEYRPGWLGEGTGTGTWSLPVSTLEHALGYLRSRSFTQGALMRGRGGAVLMDVDGVCVDGFSHWKEGALGRIRSVSATGALMLGSLRAGCIFGFMYADAMAGCALAVNAVSGVEDLRAWNDEPGRRKCEVRRLFEDALDFARERHASP